VDAVRLDWRASVQFDRCRVAAWTCAEHLRVWYELCRAGGLVFLRRTHQRGGHLVVTYSEAWVERRGVEMWAGVLSGRVR